MDQYSWSPLEIYKAPTDFFLFILGTASLDENSMSSQYQTQLGIRSNKFPRKNQMPVASPSLTDMEMKSPTMPNMMR